MAVNLEDRAGTALELLRAWTDRVGAGLAAARAELNRRHPDLGQVVVADWAAQLGAAQHVAVARAALAALRADRDRIRAQLAAVANPADTATFQARLRENLIRDAALRVQLRLARERVTAAESRVATFGELAALAEPATAGLEAGLKVAARRVADRASLRAALTAEPLDTLVADAAAMRTTELPPAHARLAALLPGPLRDRALARAAEASAFGAAVAAHEAAGAGRRDQLRAAAAPLAAAVVVVEREYVRAEAALRDYVHGATTELAAAGDALQRVVELPDLSAAQQQALDPAGRAAGVAAATAETALATAVAALAAAERRVADARLDALRAAPDADPEQNQQVVDAIAARDDPTVQGPLATARAGYSEAARAALDAWEVEVPDWLWRGAGDLAAAVATLDRLADQAARDGLRTGLDAAGDALAGALDARDQQLRRTLAVAVALTDRTAELAASTATAADRFGEFLRGDGPGGRTPTQL